MSTREKKKKRRPRGIYLPPAAAGLIRFGEEEEAGFVKIRPGWAVLLSILFVALVVVLHLVS